MWKHIVVIAVGLAVSGCNSSEVKDTKRSPQKKPATKVVKKSYNKTYSKDHPCNTSKGNLDDFGPGVENCRKENAGRLDDF